MNSASSTTPYASPADLVARARAGERRALARVISELERLSKAAPELLAAMAPYLGLTRVLGITGPPGAGKSTLVNALIIELRRRGETLGIIAVDPSSPVSGGAILGDRLRMTAGMGDDGVFIRSLASRGHVGGLSPAAVRIIDAMDAAGKSIVLLETVGAGQSEMDVAEVADVRVVVAAPGLGDDIQAMKAGLLEIADILVVNKADREGAERTAAELKAALGFRSDQSRAVPVLKTIALSGEGVGALADACLDVARSPSRMDGVARRQRRARTLIAREASQLIASHVLKSGAAEISELCEAVLSGRLAPDTAARRLLRIQE
jgi:LAO/AO transport system kinase